MAEKAAILRATTPTTPPLLVAAPGASGATRSISARENRDGIGVMEQLTSQKWMMMSAAPTKAVYLLGAMPRLELPLKACASSER